MPPQLLFDISALDLDRVIFDQEEIRRSNPHRGPMEQLNGICYVDSELDRVIGFKDVTADEFWVDGHVPGNPLLPGVLMVEAAAQLASFYTHRFMGWKGFLGFGGAEDIRFRQTVRPGCRLYILETKVWERHHRICCAAQGVVNGAIVFEAKIVGVEFK